MRAQRLQGAAVFVVRPCRAFCTRLSVSEERRHLRSGQHQLPLSPNGFRDEKVESVVGEGGEG